VIPKAHSRASRHPRAGALAICAATLGAVLLCTPAASLGAATEAPAPVARTAVVVLAPFLTWDDISAEKTPAIWSLISDGAIGNMNAHTADNGWPTFAGGTLTLSASRWVKAPEGGPIDAASLQRAREANARSLSKPTLGSLGSAVRAMGGFTFATGSSDTGADTSGRLRPAELLATDESGTVSSSYADVLVADAQAPFGLRTDFAKLSAAIGQGVTDIPGLIVVDVGDLSRSHDATAPAEVYRRRHNDAVRLLDATVGVLDKKIRMRPRRDTMLLVVPAATDKGWYKSPEFGPLIISGGGFQGQIISSSTHRPGLAPNLDIAPTILASLGATTPAEMLGKPLSSKPFAAGPAALIAQLSATNNAVGVVDQLRDAWLAPWFCYAAIGAIALAVALAIVPVGAARAIGEGVLIIALSGLPAGWLMFLFGQPKTVASAAWSFAIATVVVALAAAVVRLRFASVRVAAPLFLTTLTSLVVTADQWFGAPIQSGIFSYSVAAGWRYYGMGNEGAAILVGASIAAVALAVDTLEERPTIAAALRRWGLPAVGALVLVTAAAPFLGANAGVAVWGIVAYGLAWASLNGVRFGWRTVGLTLLAVVAAVVAFAALDLMRSGGAEGHLARFARGVLAGDVSGTTELIRRKLENNLAYLPQTNYTGLAIAMATALSVLRFAPGRLLRHAVEEAPGYGEVLFGILVGSIVAWATEDSGIAMPALMLLAGASPALLLALRAPGRTASSSIAN